MGRGAAAASSHHDAGGQRRGAPRLILQSRPPPNSAFGAGAWCGVHESSPDSDARARARKCQSGRRARTLAALLSPLPPPPLRVLLPATHSGSSAADAPPWPPARVQQHGAGSARPGPTFGGWRGPAAPWDGAPGPLRGAPLPHYSSESSAALQGLMAMAGLWSLGLGLAEPEGPGPSRPGPLGLPSLQAASGRWQPAWTAGPGPAGGPGAGVRGGFGRGAAAAGAGESFGGGP